jgi:hypothetical protein
MDNVDDPTATRANDPCGQASSCQDTAESAYLESVQRIGGSLQDRQNSPNLRGPRLLHILTIAIGGMALWLGLLHNFAGLIVLGTLTAYAGVEGLYVDSRFESGNG